MSVLALYPAIDIRGGRAVRLIQGDYARETVYDADPLDAARRWVEAGADRLHVVDLDGARSGRPVNLEHAERIAGGVDVPVQLGGGIRDPEAVEEVLATGVARVVLGTAAQRDPGLVADLVAIHGDRILASVDARADHGVAVEGWEHETEIIAAALIATLAERGVRSFVFTPIDVDGTLEGPGLEALADAAAAAGAGGAELIYSGGVGSLADLEMLADLEAPALSGVIVGRALYEGRFGIEEAITALGRGRREGDARSG